MEADSITKLAVFRLFASDAESRLRRDNFYLNSFLSRLASNERTKRERARDFSVHFLSVVVCADGKTDDGCSW
jgi:hypothetical protein